MTLFHWYHPILLSPYGVLAAVSSVVPLPRGGSYALLTRPPLETPLPVRLACVKHAAGVHPEPGIELSMRFLVALLIASLFVDKADSNCLSFQGLYPCASYSLRVRSKKYSHPYPPHPHVNPMSLLSILIRSRAEGEQVKIEKLTLGLGIIGLEPDDFHHVKVTLYR
ncbi:hypothetical protein OIU79_020341 [Salix purpurea]|uniref:Uncharacterized protein n=1 Tax=Salix purpurea TaxID=77065 RepID=A0A9Q0NU95_SALPP|nr:hypothetical protein OIU79_020341 [Salix purpurea]